MVFDHDTTDPERREALLRAISEGEALLAQGKAEAACAVLASAYQLEPEAARESYARALRLRGIHREQQGDLEGALADYSAGHALAHPGPLQHDLTADLEAVATRIEEARLAVPVIVHEPAPVIRETVVVERRPSPWRAPAMLAMLALSAVACLTFVQLQSAAQSQSGGAATATALSGLATSQARAVLMATQQPLAAQATAQALSGQATAQANAQAANLALQVTATSQALQSTAAAQSVQATRQAQTNAAANLALQGTATAQALGAQATAQAQALQATAQSQADQTTLQTEAIRATAQAEMLRATAQAQALQATVQAETARATATANSARTATVLVDAALGWQATGFLVEPNRELTVQVLDGRWTTGTDPTALNGGEGTGYVCARVLPVDQCQETLPTAPQGALIGMIGDQRFAIGRGGVIIASTGGELLLRINDSEAAADQADNSGRLTVRLESR